MHTIKALMLALMLSAIAVAPAAAQEDPYPPEETGDTTVSETVVVAGEAVRVEGDGFQPGSEVTITFNGQVLGIAAVRDDGTFSTQVIIPCVEPGDYTLAVSGIDASGAPRVDEITITVTEACEAAPPADETLPDVGGLADTGIEVTTGLMAALALIAVGGAALFLARRRSA